MFNAHLFSAIQAEIEHGSLERGMYLLGGSLILPEVAEAARPVLRNHPLHGLLMQDPYLHHAATKPRGYAGDAALIDLIYDQVPPPGTSRLGEAIFNITIDFSVSASVRHRRRDMEARLATAVAAGKRICSLACGHFREGDHLAGQDLNGITLVDQDALSLGAIRAKHGNAVQLEKANVFRFLRSAASRGETFDLIYTLGLTDYLDDRSMRLLHKLMRACLTPGGEIFLANFVPHHLARGWMDAVMDWHLIYREDAELQMFAREIGMTPRTWLDPTGSIAFCEMTEAL